MRILFAGKATTSTLTAIADAGINVELTGTGLEGLELLRHYEFDLVLLHLSLPDMDGITFLSQMRSAGKDTPAIAFAGNAQERFRAKALAAGADDVVEQDIDRAELLARMRAIVRRACGHSRSRLQVGALALDIEQHDVTVHGQHVHFTSKEFALLQLLMLRKNMVMTKDAILTNLYGGMDEPEVKIIDVFVCKIRHKLAKAGLPNFIATIWGRGYTVRDQGVEYSEPTQPAMPRQVRVAALASTCS